MKKTFLKKVLPLIAVALIGLLFAISCEKEENKVSQSGVDEILDDDYYFYTFKNWGDTFYKQEFNKYDTCFVITLHEPNNDLLAGAKMNVGHLYTKCHIVLDRWMMVNSPTKEIDSMIAYLESTGEDFGYCNLMWRYKENGRPGEIVEAFNTRTISVKVKQGVNIDDLLHEMKVPYSHYDIDGHDSNDFFIYLNCRRDISNYYCNRITETGKVYWAQPNHTLMGNFLTNAMYSSQWNLYNTGQFGGNGGYDINVQPVWNSLNFTGMGIEVAVIDEGVDVNHPDLVNNMNLGYDATGTNYMGAMFGKSSHNDAHGTACAGIIAASDNGIGIKGIAYHSRILPVRVQYYDTADRKFYCNSNWVKRGLRHAWDTAYVDVINMSWDVYDYLGYSEARTELTNACSYGRYINNKHRGCVVIYSIGNTDNVRNKEYSIFDSIITVGAINQYGERKSATSLDNEPYWGSSYGEVLSVMAPGLAIPTTDIVDTFGYNYNFMSDNHNAHWAYLYSGPEIFPFEYDYTTRFSGTSAAAPHVAGVAALMLSANDTLPFLKVKKYIEQTARKVNQGTYNYDNNPNHPNGKWHDEMGYGLVDAYNAVKAAKGYDLYVSDMPNDGGANDPNLTVMDSPDLWLRRAADGGTQHQIAGNGLNYIYVRVHNNGTAPSAHGTDSLRLFARVTSLQSSTVWNASTWQQYAVCEVPEIPVGGSVVLKLPVTLSTGLHSTFANYAFCARIDSPFDTNIPQTNNLLTNVKSNNNIAAKSIIVTRYLINDEGFSVVANFTISQQPNYVSSSNLRLSMSNNGTNILDEAEVTLIFPEDLMTDWTPSSENLKQLTDNTFLVTGETVELLDIPETELSISYNFLTENNTSTEIYKNHVIQYNGSGDDEEIVGVLTIQIDKPERAATDMFIANAGNDTAVLLNTTATLHATQINENATYRWYDKQRNFLYEGVNYSATPSQTSEYILEVTAESDGYRDLDIVKVTVVPGCIRSITPNPVTDNWVTVSYEYATTVTSAQLLIYNTATTTLVGNYDLSNLGNVSSLDIEVTNYPTGSYTVVLVCDNAVCHSKVLIRQ